MLGGMFGGGSKDEEEKSSPEFAKEQPESVPKAGWLSQEQQRYADCSPETRNEPKHPVSQQEQLMGANVFRDDYDEDLSEKHSVLQKMIPGDLGGLGFALLAAGSDSDEDQIIRGN